MTGVSDVGVSFARPRRVIHTHSPKGAKKQQQRITLVGAWTVDGTHEDGWTSGLRAVLDGPFGVDPAALPFEVVDSTGHWRAVVNLRNYRAG